MSALTRYLDKAVRKHLDNGSVKPATVEKDVDAPMPIPMSELKETGDDLDWIVHGMIARGHLSMLSAMYKAGKTTFVSLLLFALQSGLLFIGRATKKCRILVITEESEQLWAIRRNKIGLTDEISVISKPFITKPTMREWVAFINRVAGMAEFFDFDLIIFDTLNSVAPWKSENDSAETQESIIPLNRLTNDGRAVLLIHHFGNNDRVRGSTAMMAAMDFLLEFRPFNANDDMDRRRVISGKGRSDDVIKETIIALNDEGTEYRAEGDRRTMRQGELRDAILYAMTADLPGMTAAEIHVRMQDGEVQPPKEFDLRKELRKGAKDGHWLESGSGKPPKDPHRFRLVPML